MSASDADIRILIDAEDRASPKIKAVMASVDVQQQKLVRTLQGFSPKDREELLKDVVSRKKISEVRDLAAQLGTTQEVLLSVAEGYTGVESATKKATKAGKEHMSGLTRLRKYTEWRMWRFASGLIFYVALVGTVRWWTEIGFKVEAANQKSQETLRTWKQLKDAAANYAQTIARVSGGGTEGISSMGAAVMNYYDKVLQYYALMQRIQTAWLPQMKTKKGFPWATLGWPSERTAGIREDFERLMGKVKPPKEMPADTIAAADAESKWAKAVYERTKSETALARVLTVTNRMISLRRAEQEKLLKLDYMGGKERKQYYDLALATEQAAKEREELQFQQRGGREADRAKRLAAIQGTLTGLTGMRGYEAALRERDYLRQQRDLLYGLIGTVEVYGDKWFEVMENLAQIAVQLERIRDITFRREIWGLTRAQAARAGIAMDIRGAPLPIEPIRARLGRVSPGMAGTIQVDVSGLTREGSRDLVAGFSSEVGRLLRSGG